MPGKQLSPKCGNSISSLKVLTNPVVTEMFFFVKGLFLTSLLMNYEIIICQKRILYSVHTTHARLSRKLLIDWIVKKKIITKIPYVTN